MKTQLTLADLKIGDTAVIEAFNCSGPLSTLSRFIELGLFPSHTIRFEYSSPIGQFPRIFSVNTRRSICLGASECELIYIQKGQPA